MSMKNFIIKISLAAAIIALGAVQTMQAQAGYFGNYFIDTVAHTTLSNYSQISNSALISTGNPLFTPLWNANHVYNNFNTGLWFNGSTWSVYSEDSVSHLPAKSVYNVLVPTSRGTSFRVKSHNTGANFTIFSNPLTDGNPNAIVFATHIYGSPADSSDVFINSPVGVFYNSSQSKWAIFNENANVRMPMNATFSVFVADTTQGNAFVHTATSTNTTSDYTVLNHPLLNGNPQAVIIVTPLWNPGGTSSGVYDTIPYGVFYNTMRWCIFNQDKSSVGLGTAFNVLVASAAPDHTGIGTVAQEELKLKVYPNPAHGMAMVSFVQPQGATDASVHVADMLGRERGLYELTEGQETVHINTDRLQAGVYLISLVAEGHTLETQRLVVE